MTSQARCFAAALSNKKAECDNYQVPHVHKGGFSRPVHLTLLISRFGMVKVLQLVSSFGQFSVRIAHGIQKSFQVLFEFLNAIPKIGPVQIITVCYGR